MEKLSKYKESMLALEQMMNEWPMRFEMGDGELDDLKSNETKALEVRKTGKLLDTTSLSTVGKVEIYLIIKNNDYNIYIVMKNKPFIAGQYTYIKHPTCIENKYIWNFSWFQGLIREFFRNYIIPRERMILSDQTQSRRGFKFWKSLFEEYVEKKKTHKMMAVNVDDKIQHNITSEADMDKYYNDEDGVKFQFVLIEL